MTHGDTLIPTLAAGLVLAFALGAVANRLRQLPCRREMCGQRAGSRRGRAGKR